MITKEIMSGVNKAKAQEFMANWNALYTGYPLGKDFTTLVEITLNKTGITVVKITSGTANAVVEKMEKKAGLQK